MGEEKRSDRKTLRRRYARVLAGFSSDGLVGTGHLRNISPRGVFVRSDLLPSPGAEVQVFFDDGGGGHVEARGIVRWNTDQLSDEKQQKHGLKSGFGVLVPEPSVEFMVFYRKVLLDE